MAYTTYSSTTDRPVIISTWVVSILVIEAILLVNNLSTQLFITLFMGATYVCIYGNLPSEYRMNGATLTIVAPFKKHTIALKEIKQISLLNKKEQSGIIRTFGSSGIFGHWGYFYSRRLGKMQAYAKRNNPWILITLQGGKQYVIAPDNLDLFEDLKGKLLVKHI
ncbi:MAG: PH domain-containing protein [Bacteroides sp.]